MIPAPPNVQPVPLPMKILSVREKAVPLKLGMRNAAFSFDTMTTSIVAVALDTGGGAPVTGFAFNSTGRYACGAQMRDRFVPRLLDAPPETLLDSAGDLDPAAAAAAMNTGEKPGGDMERSVGIGTIEVALWDALAKAKGLPLHALLAARFGDGGTPERMFCYVGGGWYAPGQTLDDLKDEMRRYLDAGYTMVKTKVGGLPLAEDLARIEAILSILPGPGHLAVDANCGLPPERALDYAEALRPIGLAWFEEPAHPADFETNRRFVERYGNPVATGENLFSLPDVRNLVRHGGMRPGTDIVQLDVPQSYGMAACAATLAMLADHGWSAASVIPHGGNQMSLAAALGFGMGMCEAYPHVFGVFSGYADDARVTDGYLPAPTRPGIGFEAQAELYALFRSLLD